MMSPEIPINCRHQRSYSVFAHDLFAAKMMVVQSSLLCPPTFDQMQERGSARAVFVEDCPQKTSPTAQRFGQSSFRQICKKRKRKKSRRKKCLAFAVILKLQH
jgi:hypothetical protein